MRISVITPSFNQAQFLPDNLRTVSGQKEVEVEHIIVDPGSTDGSTELAQKAKHVVLINEPDRGQSHAITKGYARATGDILVWLNSDDFYPEPYVLSKVVAAFEKNTDADIIYGNVNFVDEQGKFLRKGFVNKDSPNLLKSFEYQVGIVQPGVFMRRKVFEAVGGPSEDYHYCMDYEYWVRKAKAGFKWVFIDEVLAHHRWWPGMKTSSGRGESLIEHFKVCSTYFGYIHYKWLDRYGEFVATSSDGVVNHAATVDPQVKNICVERAINRFVTQDMLTLLESSTDAEQRDTLAFIRRLAPEFKRYKFDTDELTGAISTHPDPMAEQRVAWHVFDTQIPDRRNFKTYTVPNNFSRSFDAYWYTYQHERAKEKLIRMSARRKETCVIVANGPSLNQSNLALLSHADVIISNFAIISKELMRHASYITIVNDLVARQGNVRFNDIDAIKILPFWLANSINPTEATFFVPATVEPTFCTEIHGTFSWRSTVSFLNMQLAFVLGYERVVLIGFDHSYQQAAELKEGASIMQKEEDPNHFDPRYFQGKIWQAADTRNMEEMYLLARDAYQKAGRSIVNATVGGKLEVFPRASLEKALGLHKGSRWVSRSGRPAVGRPKASRIGDDSPKVLLFDMTEMGNSTATGELKSTLFSDWPADRLLQIAKQGPHGLASVQRDDKGFQATLLDFTGARKAIAEFDPDLILYRPVPDTAALHALAMEEIRARNLPLVTWIMDDWPARMKAEDLAAWNRMQPDLDYLMEVSALRLSISEAMSEAFVRRYRQHFVPLANGVDPADWPIMSKASSKDGIFRLRFAGGLAPDMNRRSILKIAEAVERIGKTGVRISFQINTQKCWVDQTKETFAKFRHTQLRASTLTQPAYRKWLSQADAVLIAYNFDPDSLRYVQYSMANKMPECLASGAVLFAYGPRGAATIDYLDRSEAAVVVNEDSDAALEEALRELIKDSGRAEALARDARVLAFERLNVAMLRKKLYQHLLEACEGNVPRSRLEAAQRIPGTTPATVSLLSPDQASPEDFLERLGCAVLAASDDRGDTASLLLISCATALIQNPEATLPRLAEGETLARAVAAAQKALPSAAPVRQHFAKVSSHVRIKVGGDAAWISTYVRGLV